MPAVAFAPAAIGGAPVAAMPIAYATALPKPQRAVEGASASSSSGTPATGAARSAVASVHAPPRDELVPIVIAVLAMSALALVASRLALRRRHALAAPADEVTSPRPEASRPFFANPAAAELIEKHRRRLARERDERD